MTQLLTRNNLYLLVIAGLIAFILIDKGCNTHKENKQLAQDINYQDTAKIYKLKTGQLVASNTVLKLSNDEQLRILIQKDKQLADLQKQFKTIYGAAQIKEVVEVIHDTISIHDGKFTQDNDLLDLSGSVDSSHVKIDSLVLHNVQSIMIGEKKTGLLSTQTTIDVINSNPLITSNAIRGYVVHEQKWWENPKTQFIAGFICGGVAAYGIHQLAK